MTQTDTTADGRARAVRSVRFALAALRLAASADRPLGVTEIAREIDMSASSCYNVLKTLTAERFLVFDAKTKKYTLGSGALELSSKTHGAQRVFTNYRPRLLELATSLNVVVAFWEIRDERLVLTGVVDSDAAIRIQMVPGQRLPIGAGAMGRVIAAELQLRGAALEAHQQLARWHKVPNWNAYRRAVTQAAKRGWAVDEGQFLGGIATVASAICAGPADPRYCIAASGFVGLVRDPEITKIGDATHQIANEIQNGWFSYRA
jgi:DNA-binding IclR family transcriptional regulator